jgi:tyrosine-protein kinase Etk/Wzc
VRRRYRTLLLTLVAALLAGLAAVSLIRPSYEGAAMVRVDEQRIGLPALDVLSTLPTGNQVATEMEILRSRPVLTAVVDTLHLRVGLTEPQGVSRSRVLARIESARSEDSVAYRFERQKDRSFRVEELASGRVVGTYRVGERIPLRSAVVVLAPGATDQASLGLQIDPFERTVYRLGRAVKVRRPSHDANVIRIAFRGSDRELAREVPNAIASSFVAQQREAQVSTERSMVRFLRQQLEVIARDLAKAEDELRAFRESDRAINLEVENSEQVRRLAATQAERAEIDAERQAMAELIREVQSTPQGSARPASYRRLFAFPALLQSQMTAGLLGNLAQLENERSELLLRRKPPEPDVLVQEARIREIEEPLQGVATTYLASLQARVTSLDSVLAQFGSEIQRLPGREVQLARLSRRPQVLEEMNRALQLRLQEAEIAEAATDFSVRIVEQAALPVQPTGPGRGVMVAGFLLAGGMLGLGLCFVREYSDGSVRSRAELQIAAGMPVLGLIPHGESRALRSTDGRAPVLPAEAYDWLHWNLIGPQAERSLKTILFTSPLPGDGKTTTATNLAMSLARSGYRVLLVDADLRRGAIAALFGLPRSPGLADYLRGSAPTERVLHRVDIGGRQPLYVIPAGALPSAPVEALASEQMTALLRRLAADFDKIILDSPPLNMVVDATVLASRVEGVVLVVRAGVTPFDAVVYAAERIGHASAPVVGAVLNDIDFTRDASYDAAYRWQDAGRSYATAYLTPGRSETGA